MSVALVIQHAKRMRCTKMSSVAPPAAYTIFSPHYLMNGTTFEKNKIKLFKINSCFDFLYKFCPKRFSFKKNSARHYYKCGGHAVAQLVEALRYKSEGHGFDSRWCHWNFSLTWSFRPHYGPGVDSATNRNEYQEYFLGVKAAGA